MLAHLRGPGWKSFATVVYVLAMMLLGFAHAPLRISAFPGPGSMTIGVTATPLADGVFGPICGKSSSGPLSTHGGKLCDACLLTAAAGALVEPPHVVGAMSAGTTLRPVAAASFPAQTPTLAPQSRGPPRA